MASVFLWSVSNTGGIRTFFNLRQAGCKLDIYSFSISSNFSSSSLLSKEKIIDKNLLWYFWGMIYKLIPQYFFRVRIRLKIYIGSKMINENSFGGDSVVVASDIVTLVSLISSNVSFGDLIYYAQHDEALFSKENEYAFEHYNNLLSSTKFDLVANSTWLKKQILDRWGKRPVALALPGVDKQLFAKRRNIRESIIARNFMSLGRPQEWKGTQVLLKAFKKVVKLYPDATLTLYGSSNFDIPRDLQTNVKLMMGLSDDELSKLYRSSDLVINPSYYESSPGPVLEALSVGTPLISTPIGVSDEIYFTKNPDALFEAKDIEALSNKMLLLCSDNNFYRRLSRSAASNESRTWTTTVEMLAKSKVLKEK